ncbi:MAG: threonine-phosphate decarboxylase CobD [Gallionella sp.]|nr:threonine-phosphate decarboxylase CobD [Gallionella sp.]
MALEHGGRVRAAAARYGIPESRWLDLSTGINPDGWRTPEIPARIWQALPQDDDGLAEAASLFYGSARLLPVAGSQAAIQALPGLRRHSLVSMAVTAYAEHARAWQGHDVLRMADADLLHSDADVLVIVNPNNPTAKRYAVEELLSLHARLAARGGWLVVDEAFMDATPEHSLAPFCPRAGLIVLRSPGKFFGLAGARAGFVLATEDVLQPLAELLGPWPIAAPSRYVVKLAMLDVAWQTSARQSLQLASRRLSEMLIRHGLPPVGSNSLFQWVCCEDALIIHQRLAQQGILTRLFDMPASLRFGLPFGEAQWARLDAALGDIQR